MPRALSNYWRDISRVRVSSRYWGTFDDALADTGFPNELSGQVGGLLMSDHPADHVPAIPDRENFRKSHLLPASSAGLVEMTLPDKPNSRHQRYRLTPTGRQRPKTAPNQPC